MAAERYTETHKDISKAEKPEQLAHGVKAINGAAVGTVLDTGPANITQLLFTTAPTSYDVPTFDPTGLPLTGYMCLVDQVAGFPPRVVYNEDVHVGGGHSPHASHKVSAYNIPFTGNLVLQSCPTGGVFSITTA